MSEPKESAKKTKTPLGRPTIFNEDIANMICEKVATHTFGIRRICELYPELPCVDTIYRWRYIHESFSEQYARAKLKQADILAEELLEIADDGQNDWMEKFGDKGENIGWQLNGEHVQRSRLRIDTRKWLASKLLPKQYGNTPPADNKQDGQSEIEKLLNEE
jgi:hypothetical protein